MKCWVSAIFAILIFSARAPAEQVIETFSSRSHFASGTAIWNQVLGKVHPTLQVMNYEAGFTPLPVAVGDGSDGPFDVSTYANFGTVSGSTIFLDTSLHPILQVTYFNLAQGWTLEPVGPNPLIIESLSYVYVSGTINCQGGNGGGGVGATPGAGGVGRCGGQNGGAGGAPTAAGASGTNANGSVTGGQGGNYVAASYVGGGGGGSWNTTSGPGSGANSSASGGQAGLSSSDPAFANNLGSAGGGGGSGSGTVGGGGGGAGGGIVIIHAVGDFDLGQSGQSFGYIYASGGTGGNSDSTAGPGGGGGGGSVQVFVGGTINIYNPDGLGASQANAGAGGTNTAAASGGAGGLGRSWFSSVNYNGVGFYTPAEQAPVSHGNVEFNSVSQYVITKPYDLLFEGGKVESFSVSPSSADFTIQIAGSNDGFVSDDTGWTTNPSVVSGKRYLRLQISIATSNVNTPTMVDSATIQYQPAVIDNFNFKGAGCGLVKNGPTYPMSDMLLLLAPLVFLIALKLKSQTQLPRK